jgi:hypothetical protein
MTQLIHQITVTISAPDRVNLSNLPDYDRRLGDKMERLTEYLHSETQQYLDDNFPKSFYLNLEVSSP